MTSHDLKCLPLLIIVFTNICNFFFYFAIDFDQVCDRLHVLIMACISGYLLSMLLSMTSVDSDEHVQPPFKLRNSK